MRDGHGPHGCSIHRTFHSSGRIYIPRKSHTRHLPPGTQPRGLAMEEKKLHAPLPCRRPRMSLGMTIAPRFLKHALPSQDLHPSTSTSTRLATNNAPLHPRVYSFHPPPLPRVSCAAKVIFLGFCFHTLSLLILLLSMMTAGICTRTSTRASTVKRRTTAILRQ